MPTSRKPPPKNNDAVPGTDSWHLHKEYQRRTLEKQQRGVRPGSPQEEKRQIEKDYVEDLRRKQRKKPLGSNIYKPVPKE